MGDAGGGPGGNPDLYTTFLAVSASVANTGPVDGATVVQLYISFPKDYSDPETGEAVDFPVRVLRGFEKPFVKKGGEELVEFEVTRRDLSYWDVKRQNWVMPSAGKFGISVGFSSRDLPLEGTW